MKINKGTKLTGLFQGTTDDLLKPFENSKQLPRAKRLAPMYVKFGKLFGIRADLAFAQMCHETGLLNFTGIAKPDWNNFCGLGVTGPSVVQKFLTEDHGVIAHYAHLAWYCFKDHVNSMCSNKFDPRHSDLHSRFNGDSTLGRLNKSWAPSETYTKKIIEFANIINGDITINNGNELEPESEPKPELLGDNKFDIIVQLGHVGRKKGATGTFREIEFTTKLGEAMELLLKGSGLKFRIMQADNWQKPEPNKTKIFFAIHGDGSTNKNARGFSCGYLLGTNQRFKDEMAISYKQLTGFQQRPDNYTVGLKNYYGYKHILADFYLVLEHGFLTSEIERGWLFANIDKIAKHHVEVIRRFLIDVKG